jgi:hypothetical protein
MNWIKLYKKDCKKILFVDTNEKITQKIMHLLALEPWEEYTWDINLKTSN